VYEKNMDVEEVKEIKDRNAGAFREEARVEKSKVEG